ncbi:MAG: hypothetical protein D6738_04820 [Acidobacteria bacterium]|nr:MAG: hypothetical protein D6738_04820 [Acidobacteriota bacterium]
MPARRFLPQALLAMLAALATTATARAAVTAVSPSPAARNVTVSRATSVPLVWTVTRSVAAGGAGATVFSSAGTFRAAGPSGPVLGTVTRGLSQTRPVAPLTVFSLRETVLVPAAVVDAAIRLGVASVFYVRTFDDGFGAAAGAVELRITGGAASAFGIERLELAFANGRVIDVVDAGEQVRAVARATFSGSGLLRAAWEIAEPPATSGGAPVFRRLATVRRWVTGSAPVDLASPLLPARLSGLHLVRLRIAAPGAAFAEPELRYVVRAAAPERPAPMRVLSPTAGAVLGPKTRFGWQAVAGAQVYRLELLDAGSDGPRVAGVVLGAGRTWTSLPETTRARLVPGRRYAWRVQAVDGTGRVIGQSEPRTLRVSLPQPAEVTPAGNEAPETVRRRRQAPR